MWTRPINKIHYTSDFQKAYNSLPKNLQNLVDKKDAIFRKNAFTPSLDTHKLSTWLKGFWSFSINKKWRVLFRFISNDKAIFYDVGPHDIYKR